MPTVRPCPSPTHLFGCCCIDGEEGMHRQELQHLLLHASWCRRLLQHAAQLLNGPLPLLRAAVAALCRIWAGRLQESVLQLAHILLQALGISAARASPCCSTSASASTCGSAGPLWLGLVSRRHLGKSLQAAATVALQGQRHRDAHLCWQGEKGDQTTCLAPPSVDPRAQHVWQPVSSSRAAQPPCPALHCPHLALPCRSMLQCAPCTFWRPSAGGCPPS